MTRKVTTCDRCGKAIEYRGWTGFLKNPKPKRLFITEILNGNPSGYDYWNIDRELCAECMKSFERWMNEG